VRLPENGNLPEDLKRWIKRYDIILFMEERFGSLLSAAKEAGKKTINYVSEKMSPMERKAVAEASDMLVSPNGIEGTEHIRLGVDTEFFKPKEPDEKDKKHKKARVFAPMGWGGDYDRRNDNAITAALSRLQCRDKAEMSIHRQGPPKVIIEHMVTHVTQVLSRKEMADAYAKSDVCVWYPKWKRSDLTPMEAMASGVAVVGWDGIGFKEESCAGLYEDARVPDIHELAVKIAELSEDKEKLEKAKKEARETALELHNWRKNGKEFLKLMEGI